MKIYKDLNIIVVKDKKLDNFKTYKVWFLIFFILSLSSITAFIFKNQINFLSNFIIYYKRFRNLLFQKVVYSIN